MTNPYVFISYSREDRAFVDRLSRDLRAAGIATWQDTKEIVAGDNWQNAIEDSLPGGGRFAHVPSAQTARSKWMQREVRAVLSYGTRPVPLILDEAGEQEIPSFLRQYQCVDFRENDDEALSSMLHALEPFGQVKPMAAYEEVTKGHVFLSYAEEALSTWVGKGRLGSK